MTVTFAPTVARDYSGNVTVDSDATEGTNTFSLSGSGTSSAGEPLADMVFVEGGTLAMSMGSVTLATFHVGRYEVTESEWFTVVDWALGNGYEFSLNWGLSCGEDFPAHSMSWHDAVKWCNARTEMVNAIEGRGLVPVYYTDADLTEVYRSGEIPLTHDHVNWSADGYRLPTEAEWEFAARGGKASQGYPFSGSEDVNEVAWSADNTAATECPQSFDFSGTPIGPFPVGTKAANELGIHDMSGNVFEMCWDWYAEYDFEDTVNPRGPFAPIEGEPWEIVGRVIRGGGWLVSGEYFPVTERIPDGGGSDGHSSVGFRVARTPSPGE